MWFYLPINPEPWAIGPVSVGKRGGKYFPIVGRNQQLHGYKEAVKDELELQGAQMLPEGAYELGFYFWRGLETNTSGSRMNTADATNLQKATEDALHGVLFDNDRDVREVRSVFVEQAPGVEGGIGIYAGLLNRPAIVPDEIAAARSWVLAKKTETSDRNVWPPR